MKPPTSGGFFLEQNNGTKCDDLGAERLGILEIWVLLSVSHER